jgi:hypothetical protein
MQLNGRTVFRLDLDDSIVRLAGRGYSEEFVARDNIYHFTRQVETAARDGRTGNNIVAVTAEFILDYEQLQANLGFFYTESFWNYSAGPPSVATNNIVGCEISSAWDLYELVHDTGGHMRRGLIIFEQITNQSSTEAFTTKIYAHLIPMDREGNLVGRYNGDQLAMTFAFYPEFPQQGCLMHGITLLHEPSGSKPWVPIPMRPADSTAASRPQVTTAE